MKILVADKFQSEGIESLRAMGCDVVFEPDITKDVMAAAVERHGPDVLIVRSTKVDAAAIGAGKKLSLIVRAGAGYDSIDVAEASRCGIYVANCPGKNSVAVAELAWGLILACDRRIPDQTADLKAGSWNKKEYSKAKGLKGRTLGIVGLGQIGREVARRGAAFEMNVIGWSRSLTAEKAEQWRIGFCSDLSDLARQSDVVTVHVAATAETQQLIDSSFIDAMQPGAYLVNTSRGSVVDQQALIQGMAEKGLRAGLDVFADEPGSGTGDFGDPIAHQTGIYGTHHVGASTDQAQAAIAEEAVRIVQGFLEQGEVCHCVNLASRTPATSLITVRHVNQPGVLAHVFQIVGDAKINVEEMQNVIYDGGQAACAKIQLSDQLAPEHIQSIADHQHVLSINSARIA